MPSIPINNRLKNPLLNGAINPRNNWVIDPLRNWQIDPARNWQIDPARNWQIDPARNWQINPARNWQINPARNWQINPARNWQINPARNWQVTPFRNSNFSGLFIFDRENLICAYYGVLIANGQIMLLYNVDSVICFFAVRRSTGFSICSSDGVYAGHLESNEQKGYNWFDVQGDWKYFVV